MKFRASMEDALHMREFHNISATLSKLAKEFVMKITTDRVHFIANEESSSAAPLVWFDMAASSYFDEYLLEAASAQHPHILLAIATTNFNRALPMLRGNVRCCRMRLTNVQFPCLTIETELNADSGAGDAQGRQIVHDVPVRVIARSEWPAYRLPRVPAPDLALIIPSVRLIRGLMDKLKNLSPSVTFYGTKRGELNLVAEAELATITTRYSNLELSSVDCADRVDDATCMVDCRKASIFFNALQLPVEHVTCAIAHEKSIHLQLDVREGVQMHAILAAICIE